MIYLQVAVMNSKKRLRIENEDYSDNTSTEVVCRSPFVGNSFQPSTGHDVNPPLPESKRLRFSDCLSVVLVPCVKEYKDAGLFDSLWHAKSDLESFRIMARKEVFDFMRDAKCYDLRSAIACLYQDSNMCGEGDA